MLKRLTSAQTEEMKKMVVSGVAPEDIANHYGIAISSVHNYKRRFKEEGVKFPSVKGKRPSGMATKPAGAKNVSSEQHTYPSASSRKVTGSSHFRFVVNGVSIEVSAAAKSVNIDRNEVRINF